MKGADSAKGLSDLPVIRHGENSEEGRVIEHPLVTALRVTDETILSLPERYSGMERTVINSELDELLKERRKIVSALIEQFG